MLASFWTSCRVPWRPTAQATLAASASHDPLHSAGSLGRAAAAAVCGGFRYLQRKPPQTAPICPPWRQSARRGGANARRWRQSAVAPIGGGGGANRRWRWRQSAFGGGANRRLAVAPIGGGRWRGQPGNRVATARLKFSVYLPRKTMLVIRI